MASIRHQSLLAEFPVLARQIHGHRLAYLDNAATSLKPQVVGRTVNRYYTDEAASVHRGAHTLSEEATAKYEVVRQKVADFLNASSSRQIIFNSGTTAGINMLARSFGERYIKAGDEVLITTMEHHANIVPWQMLCAAKGAVLKVAPINERGELILEEFEKLVSERTKIISVVHVSNSLGTINPVDKIMAIARQHGVPVLLDAAQSAPHMPIDVQKLDCDFLCLSAHKIFGPTGLGVVYMKPEWLDKLPPVIGGGNMIRSVSFAKTTYAEAPTKFEAGTPPIGQVLGFGAALDYIQSLGGMAMLEKHELALLDYALPRLKAIPGLRLIGDAEARAAVISFVVDEIHPHDMGSILDQQGVAIRAGHHCCQPVMEFFNIPATGRASFSFYNTPADVDALIAGIYKAKEIFS